MKSKLIILLVLASLAQGSYVPTLIVPYGISEEQVPMFNEIITNQVAAATVYEDVVEDLFNVLSDLKANADHDSAKVYKTLARVKRGIDLSFDSFLIALGQSCSAVEDARKKSHAYSDHAAEQVVAAFELALQSRRRSNNRAAIESSRVVVQEDLTNMVKSYYDSIRICINTTDVNVLTVFDTVENGSLLGKVHLVNAIFNAIKVRATATNAKNVGGACRLDIEDFKEKAAAGFKTNIDYTYSLLKTHMINFNLGYRNQILYELFLNQYAVTVSFEKYSEGHVPIFNRIREYLKRIYLGLNYDGDLDFSRDDVASGTTAANWNTADHSNIASIRAIHTDSFSTIDAAGEYIYGTNFIGADLIYDVIQAAGASVANYTEVLDKIASLRNILIPFVPKVTKLYYDLIRNNQTFDAETEAELATFYEELFDGIMVINERTLDGITLLANAAHTRKVTEDHFSQVEVLLNDIDYGAAQTSQGIAAGSLAVLLSNNPN